MPDISLVLLPGLDGTGIAFRPLLGALPAWIGPQVHAYPGATPATYEQLLAKVLAALPRDAEFALLGESFSGPLALRAAATRPRGLHAVVLCASFVRNPMPWLPHWAAPLVRPFPFRFYPVVTVLKRWFGRFSTPELRALLAEALAGVERPVLAARVRALLQVDASDALRACPVPILYLAGSHDCLVPKRNLRLIQTLRPDAQVAWLNAPHVLLQTQPVAAAQAIAAFLATVERNRQPIEPQA
ncbi:MAG: alpha/beta fold hydrolase [Thermoanaerobaculales bacterium]